MKGAALLGRLAPHLGALASSAAGLVLVVGAVVAMNDEVPAPEAHDRTPGITLDPIRPKPPPKAPERPPPAPKREPSAERSDRRAPPPSLSSALGGVDLGLAELGLGSGADLDKAAGLAGPGKDAGALVMSEGAVDVPLRAVERAQPAYPPRARADGVEGAVTLSLLVSAAGTVERARVVSSEPAGVFDQAALDAVRGWRFEPASYSGKPVKVWARQVVRFSLM